MGIAKRVNYSFWGIFALVLAWVTLALIPSAQASTAYGTVNNFDCVNDTGVEAHGFDIELDDVHSKDITYTYDYNHYGVPSIAEDTTSVPGHTKVLVHYAAAKTAGGWSAYTAIPAGPIPPTQGHQFTNPSINFGGEHFGVGYYGAPTAVKYNWLIDDGAGNLVHGPPVYVATPTFVYNPPAAAAPAFVQAAIVPPPPPAPPVFQFGVATWVKEIKTTTHNANNVELGDLVDPDPDNPTAKNWANGEPAEVEVEWKLLQTEFANPANPKGVLQGANEDLPGGDEVITRRYEFYKYTGPIDAETGEAMADTVAADGKHGLGSVTYASNFDVNLGEWVIVKVDTSTLSIVGDFFGAQMSGFAVAPQLGMIDHIPDGVLNVAYAERTVVVPGANTPFHATTTGALPDGTKLDEFTGIFSGTPTVTGVFTFTVNAKDLSTDAVLATKIYTVTIPGEAPLSRSIATSASPAAGGSTTGDGVYDDGTPVIVVATHNPGYAFVNWTENGAPVSVTAIYPFTVNGNRTLVANFTSVLASVTLTADTPSPALVNTPITLNAVATGGTNVQYQFWQYHLNTIPAWSQLQGYSTTAACIWTPGTPGNYLLSATAKDEVTGTEVNTTLWYTIRSGTSLSRVVLSANIPSPQAVNTSLTLSAVATGGTGVLYQFWVYNPNATPVWSQLQGYSTSATCLWFPSAAGSYLLSTTARDSVTGTIVSNTLWYTITTASTLSNVTLTANPPSPHPSNPPITLTALATGGTNVQYQFWAYTPNATPAWSQLQGYSTSATCVWSPSRPGSYLLSATAQDGISGVTVNATLWYTISGPPLSAVTVTTNPASPQAANTKITFSATTTGGANVQYQFWLYNPNATPAWSQLQGYSTLATCTWTPTISGSYFLSVTAQDGVSEAAVSTTLWYTITGSPLTAVALTTSPASPQKAGTPITLSATATGGTNVQYQFWLYNPSAAPAWSQLQGYTTSATCTWTPAMAGNYLLSATARDGATGTEVNATSWYAVQ